MKVVHVVGWFAPGNPLGGPARVALNEADDLRRRGHDVTVIAARPLWPRPRGWSAASSGVRGFRGIRIVPGSGFAGIVAPGLWWWMLVRAPRFDVVHVHLARDLVTLPAGLLATLRRVPWVAQTHGMIDHSTRRSARVLDRIATRRALSSAGRVLVLSPTEAADVTKVARAEVRVEMLPNGVPLIDDLGPPDQPVEVIFCARLHPRKRPVAFTRMAIDLVLEGSDARFTLVGADEGELDDVRRSIDSAAAQHPIVGERVTWEGGRDPDTVAARLARATILVLPAVNEPFGMVVAEAMAVGRPVVITESCELATFVREHDCGRVVPDDDHDALVAAVRELCTDTSGAAALGRRGRDATRSSLSMIQIGARLEQIYADLHR